MILIGSEAERSCDVCPITKNILQGACDAGFFQELGIAAVSPRAPVGGRFDDYSVRKAVTGCTRVLRYAGIRAAVPVAIPRIAIVSNAVSASKLRTP
jgi:predicted deacylase